MYIGVYAFIYKNKKYLDEGFISSNLSTFYLHPYITYVIFPKNPTITEKTT